MSASKATPSTSLEKLTEESVAQVLLVASEEVLIELENPACPGSPSAPLCRRGGIPA